MKCFGYLQDPFFLVSLITYTINQLLIRPHGRKFLNHHYPSLRSFLHSHFDDLLLMPVAWPVILWAQRVVDLRKHDQPPRWREMFAHLALWSRMCKFAGPFYFNIGVADPWDILFFVAGGLIACIWWRRSGKTSQSARE